MARKSNANEYMLLFRGGADPKDLTKQQMQQIMNNWYTWMGELKKRRQLKLGNPLEEKGKIMAGKNGERVQTYAESKDSVGGYLLIQARNLADATKIAKGCPIFNNGGTVEVRPVVQMPAR